MRNQKNLAEIIRNLLVGHSIAEEDIQEGMNVFFAQGMPASVISLDMVKVGSVISGRLRNGLKGFRGILPTGEDGSYRAIIDYRLNVTNFRIDKVLSAIYDRSLVTSSPKEVFVKYNNGILIFEWRNPQYGTESLPGIHTIRDKDVGIFLVSKKDPKTIRLRIPGLDIVPDINTQTFEFERDKYWRIVQEIENGPGGEFVLPGYREVPEQDYQKLQKFLEK